MNNVLVYTRENCVQCKYTKTHMDARGITYNEIDVDLDDAANSTVALQAAEMGCAPALPFVVVLNDARDQVVDQWFGFKLEKIRGLVPPS